MRPSGETGDIADEVGRLRFSSGTMVNVRAGCQLSVCPVELEHAACDPPPTYNFLPSGENVNPSHPSATGVRLVSSIVSACSTLTEGGLYPPFRTSRYLPSFDNAEAIGKVSSETCLPAGSQRPSAVQQKAASGAGPPVRAAATFGK